MPTSFNPPAPLEVTAACREDLPRSNQDLFGAALPDWVRQLCLAHAAGKVPVVTFSQTEQEPGRFWHAATIDGFLLAWRYEGDDIWSAVSVWCDWLDEDDDLEA